MHNKTRSITLLLVIILPLLLGACTSAAVSPSASELSLVVVTETPAVSDVAQATITGPKDMPEGTPGVMPQGTPSAGGPGGNPPDGTPPAGGPCGGPVGNPPDGTPPAGGPGGGPGGNPPDGTPPSGGPGNNPPGGAPSDSSNASSLNIIAAYTVDGTTESQIGQTYSASNTDQSAIYVLNAGNLTLKNATVTTSGSSSSSDSSSFYGLNAGVLATTGSKIDISDSTVTTTGNGANGIFATGNGSAATISNVKIDCTGQYAHAVMATLGGALTLTNVNMTTAGASSGAIATDRGSGTIQVTGGTVLTTGSNSPGIYSTGAITVSDATILATGSEAAVIEGANSITLTNTALASSKEDKWGIMIYQSMSGDAEGTKGIFTMTGGSLGYSSKSGPLFYVTNSTGTITLKSVNIELNSGTLIEASAGNWGKSGSNGGAVIFTADGQTLTGDMIADNISSLTATLQNGSSLTGAINSERTAEVANLTLDGTSIWTVTADSYLTTLNTAGISGTSITNIIGNGHTVYYDANANSSLGGQTYILSGGGYLKPTS
jgi:hypothetical protein